MSFDLNTFDLTTILPVSRVEGMTHAVVNNLDFREAEWGMDFALSRLAAAGVTDLSEWEIVGSRFTDLSGWCEHEGKMEFGSEELLLLVRETDHKAAMSAFLAEQAKPLTHNPFAGLLR